jgi:DNA-binding beta-propeller fold protein YncE
VVHQGTVVRVVLDLDARVPRVDSETVIASGFAERTDSAALVIGPTGVGLSQHDGALYVADTLGNAISVVPAPLALPGPLFGTGFTLTRRGALNGPLGLVVAPNGDVITFNSNDGNAVETSPSGHQVATAALDTTAAPPAQPGAGALFGAALNPQGNGLYFVDDISNSLNVTT